MKTYPVVFFWKTVKIVDDGGEIVSRKVMISHPRYSNVCARQFAEDGEYTLVIQEERSQAAHNAYFAAVGEAFNQLPETIAPRFPTAEHLRKWVLIEVGLFTEKEFVCANNDQANALGKYLRTEDDFVRISVHGSKVIVRRAKSQSYAAMPHKDEFQQSRQLVLDYLDDLCGVERGTMWREGGRHA